MHKIRLLENGEVNEANAARLRSQWANLNVNLDLLISATTTNTHHAKILQGTTAETWLARQQRSAADMFRSQTAVINTDSAQNQVAFGETVFRQVERRINEEIRCFPGTPIFVVVYHHSNGWHGCFEDCMRTKTTGGALPGFACNTSNFEQLAFALQNIRLHAQPAARLCVLMPANRPYVIAEKFTIPNMLSPLLFDGPATAQGAPLVYAAFPTHYHADVSEDSRGTKPRDGGVACEAIEYRGIHLFGPNVRSVLSSDYTSYPSQTNQRSTIWRSVVWFAGGAIAGAGALALAALGVEPEVVEPVVEVIVQVVEVVHPVLEIVF